MNPIDSHNDIFCILGLQIRPIRPSDKQKLVNGFTRLSSKSRYFRFFGQKSVLTAEELRRFTELDGNDHFALGAFELSEAGDEGDTVGVARFIRLNEDPGTAEIAVTVIDDWQGQGIGRFLLQRLLTVACERSVKRIRSYMLAENERMRKLIESVFGRAILRREGSVLIGDFPIPDCGSTTA